MTHDVLRAELLEEWTCHIQRWGGVSGGETCVRGKARSSFIIPNLQTRKLESKETDSLALSHTASMGLR